jgi:S-adenosyl methyltransferase
MRNGGPDDAEADFDWTWSEESEAWVPAGVDTTKPSVARMYDYYLGGKDNYAVDREVGDQVLAAFPNVRDIARDNRRFLVNAVRFMAGSGVRQFIDLGTGIPTSPNVHEVAREIHPDARVVYVDNDPVVMAHNRALRATTPGVIAVQHDLRQPADILADPELRELVDFEQPVGVLFLAVLHFVRHELTPGIVATFRKALAPGSLVAISALTTEHVETERIRQVQELYLRSGTQVVFRSRAQVEQLFEGLDLVEPGLVDVTQWRSDGTPGTMRGLCGVGIKN